MPKQVLKIAYMIDSLVTGGAERLAVTFSNTVQSRQDIQLTIITLQNYHTPFLAEIEAIGVPIFATPKSKLYDVKRFWKLWLYMKREKFDLIHSHLATSNILAPLLGKLLGIPVIASLHNTTLGSRAESSIQNKLQVWLLANITKTIIGVGPRVVEAHQHRFPHQPIVSIPNAVEVIPELPQAEKEQLRREISGTTDRPIILSVGSFTLQKGFKYLLDSISILQKRYPNVLLAIAGGGALKDELNSHCEKLNLKEHVVFLGQRSDVPALLKAVDLYVNSSLWEGLAISILEAMSAGLPIVATRVGDTPTIIDTTTGILVEAEDADELAQAMAQFLENPSLGQQCGKRAKQRIIEQYSAESWAAKLITIYHDTCQNKS